MSELPGWCPLNQKDGQARALISPWRKQDCFGFFHSPNVETTCIWRFEELLDTQIKDIFSSPCAPVDRCVHAGVIPGADQYTTAAPKGKDTSLLVMLEQETQSKCSRPHVVQASLLFQDRPYRIHLTSLKVNLPSVKLSWCSPTQRLNLCQHSVLSISRCFTLLKIKYWKYNLQHILMVSGTIC